MLIRRARVKNFSPKRGMIFNERIFVCDEDTSDIKYTLMEDKSDNVKGDSSKFLFPTPNHHAYPLLDLPYFRCSES